MECVEYGVLLIVITTILSSGLGAPTLSVDTTPSNYGTAETLKCTDPTYIPGNGYNWWKEDVMIFNNKGGQFTTGKYSESIDETTFKLVINDIDVSDEGNYTCNHNFTYSNSLDLEVESKGNIKAKLSSSNLLEVTFRQIYPNTSSANITCDSNTVVGSFVSSVADGDRFTNIWHSNNTFSTEPSSCSALVTLRTTFSTDFSCSSVNTVLLTHCLVLILIPIHILFCLFVTGIILGLILVKTTCCCDSFYKGESCKDCVNNYYCMCRCFEKTPCGAFCNIRELPYWYQKLWAVILCSPVAFGIWLVWKIDNNFKVKNIWEVVIPCDGTSLGATIGAFCVTKIRSKGPADGKLKVGDMILKIDQMSVENMDLKRFRSYILGTKNPTKLNLQISKDGFDDTSSVEVNIEKGRLVGFDFEYLAMVTKVENRRLKTRVCRLEKGNCILSINGKRTAGRSNRSVNKQLENLLKVLKLSIKRDGREINAILDVNSKASSGIAIRNDKGNIEVTAIEPQSVAEIKGILVGDCIQSVNGVSTTNLKDAHIKEMLTFSIILNVTKDVTFTELGRRIKKSDKYGNPHQEQPVLKTNAIEMDRTDGVSDSESEDGISSQEIEVRTLMPKQNAKETKYSVRDKAILMDNFEC